MQNLEGDNDSQSFQSGVEATGESGQVFFFTLPPGGIRWEMLDPRCRSGSNISGDRSGADTSVSRKHSPYPALAVNRNGMDSTASDLGLAAEEYLQRRRSCVQSAVAAAYPVKDIFGFGECPETRHLALSSAERYPGDEVILDLRRRRTCGQITDPAPAAAGRWDTRNLCYEFDDEFPDVAKPAVLRAFETWEEPLDFTFSLSQRPPGKADIVIAMYSGDHGDGQPFTPGFLAHAFYPPHGRMHFNRDQIWWCYLLPPPAGLFCFDIQTTAAHEIGHLLGIDHIDDPNAVMHRSLEPGELRRGLTDADVAALKVLYDPN